MTALLRPNLAGWSLWAVLVGLALTVPALAFEPDNRPIDEVRLLGLDQIEPKLVRNSIRSNVGNPYDSKAVEQDIVRLTNLGYFSGVTAFVEASDNGGVILSYQLTELPILQSVQIRGNRAIISEKLYPVIVLRSGDPVDPFLIDRAKRAIVEAYEDKGYFVTDITIDQKLLDEQHKLVFNIREGPRIRIRDVQFEGNVIFSDKELSKQVNARTYRWLLRQKAVIDRDQLTLDATRIRDYYRDRGYLEAEVDRRINITDDQRDASVTFLITEGPRWRVNDIRIESITGQPLLFTDAQIKLNMELRPGAVYSARKLSQSYRQILDLYGQLGFLDTRIVRRADGRPGIDRLFNEDDHSVDLLVRIQENSPTTVGKVTVRGNQNTRTKVILRETRGVTPGRPYDRSGLAESRRRLNESPLFRGATITLLGDEGDPERDAIIEVIERNTGSINLGASISSDVGLLGAIDITQRNFDITDVPQSWEELLTNRAFRGAGQTFNMTISPGNENSRYAIGLSDPYFLDTDYFFDSSLSFDDNDRDEFDQRRTGVSFGLGKRFGDVWSAGVTSRVDNVRILDIEPEGATDVFDVQGNNLVTGLALRVTRSTTDSNFQPSRGSRTVFRVEQTGVYGGDFDFTKLQLSFDKFWTVDEDFLGRKSIVSFRFDTGYIPQENESPTFERFYAGGHTTLRGFDNRGVGPRGIQNNTLTLGDDPVGGDFLLLTGLQYEFPLVARYMRGVVFTDQGTLTPSDITLDEWRVSVGFGIRLQIDFLAQAPFAIDFAIPLMEEDTDERQVVSFAIDIPFR